MYTRQGVQQADEANAREDFHLYKLEQKFIFCGQQGRVRI
jgi:hypothetical protein